VRASIGKTEVMVEERTEEEEEFVISPPTDRLRISAVISGTVSSPENLSANTGKNKTKTCTTARLKN